MVRVHADLVPYFKLLPQTRVRARVMVKGRARGRSTSPRCHRYTSLSEHEIMSLSVATTAPTGPAWLMVARCTGCTASAPSSSCVFHTDTVASPLATYSSPGWPGGQHGGCWPSGQPAIEWHVHAETLVSADCMDWSCVESQGSAMGVCRATPHLTPRIRSEKHDVPRSLPGWFCRCCLCKY